MDKMTITEGLAEIKTIGKRIEKKRDFVNQYLIRPDNVRDPLEKEGGSEINIRKSVQGITDLYKRWVTIRLAIQKVNYETQLTIKGQSMSIAQWLIWRREVSQHLKGFWDSLADQINKRTQYTYTTVTGSKEILSAIVSYPASAITEERELLESVLGELDGQLSLKNATTFIEV